MIAVEEHTTPIVDVEATMTEVGMIEAEEREVEEIVGGNRYIAIARFRVVVLKIQKHHI